MTTFPVFQSECRVNAIKTTQWRRNKVEKVIEVIGTLSQRALVNGKIDTIDHIRILSIGLELACNGG